MATEGMSVFQLPDLLLELTWEYQFLLYKALLVCSRYRILSKKFGYKTKSWKEIIFYFICFIEWYSPSVIWMNVNTLLIYIFG